MISERKELLGKVHHLLLNMELIRVLLPNELAWYYITLDFNLEDVFDLAPEKYSALIMRAVPTPDDNPTSCYMYDLVETMLRIAPSQ